MNTLDTPEYQFTYESQGDQIVENKTCEYRSMVSRFVYEREVSICIKIPTTMKWLGLLSFVVVFLGVFREFYVFYYGTDTFLKDLGQIALDDEGTIAVWYSSTIMVFSSAIMFLICAVEKLKSTASTLHWPILGTLFALMSIDESVSFHEVLITPLRTYFDLGGVLYFSWVVVACPIVLGLAFYYFPFILKLRPKYAMSFVLSGVIYVGGALGMEFMGGYFFSTVGENSIQYIFVAAIEEIMELVGLSLFAAVLISYVGMTLNGLALPVIFEQNFAD